MTASTDTLQSAFPTAEVALPADSIPTLRVPLAEVLDIIQRVRGELGYHRFVDLTAVDHLSRELRFELVYLFYSLDERAWLRVSTRTDGEAPSLVAIVPGANWYERELFDLFGVTFVGHPNLQRIMLPDDWLGHPLQRNVPLGSEPVDFTVTRGVYGAS